VIRIPLGHSNTAERIKVELAKFADRHRTRAGREAGRLLADMKEEMRRREQP